MCIQRCWRWNLFKRRIELLAGAVRVARSVRTSTLYIEERLLSGLNTISTVDRYPRLPESQLAMGFAEAPVILRRPQTLRRRNSGLSQVGQGKPLMYGREGFPKWFLQEAPIELAPSDVSLRPLRGLQGLLLEGLGGPDAFNFFGEDKSFLEVASPLLENFAVACAAPGGLEKDLQVDLAESTIAASGGCLRFAELRYASVLQAKQRAVLLYLCTFNFEKHKPVPLLRRHQLYDVQTAYNILQLWELYGLDWPHRSKVGFFLLRQREPKPSEVVYVNGTKHRSAVAFRAEWQSAEEDQKRTGVTKEKTKKEALQRLEDLKQKKRRKDLQEIQEILATVSVPQLLEALETGKLPGDVDLHSVEAWILGNRANFAPDRANDKKLLAKRVAADKLAMKMLLLEAKEANRAQKFTGDDSEAQRLKSSREWEERLMKFYGSVRAERVSAETQCLVRAHRTWHGDQRWLVEETESAKSAEHEVSETSSERAEREEHERQMELAEELNEHIREVREQLEQDGDDGDFDWDDGWGFGVPMQHAMQSKRSGRSQAFSDSWYMSTFTGEDLHEEVESEKQREKEAVYQAQRQKIFQEKEARKQRGEMRQMAATFCNRRCAIESQIRMADQQQVKVEHQDRTKEKVEAKKRLWQQRRDVMELKNQQSLEHRRRQVDELRSELQWLTQTKNEKLHEELQGKKAAVIEKKVTKRLTRATQRLDMDYVNSFDAFGRLPMPTPAMNTTCSAFSEALTGVQMSKRSSHSVDFRKTIACTRGTESTTSGFTAEASVDPNQSWASEADACPRMAATMQTLPEVSTGWAAKLAATDSNWKKKIEDDKLDAKSTARPWPEQRRFPALRLGGDHLSGVNPWRQRLALSAR